MSTNNNALTISDLVSDDSKYDELVVVTFPDGRYTEVFKYFRNSKIDEMIETLSEFLVEYENKTGKITDKKIINYCNLHILLYFSKLTDGIPNLYEDKVTLFEQIIDSELAETIFSSFEKSETTKVYDRMYEKIDAYLELTKQRKIVSEQIREHVENSDLENKELLLESLYGTIPDEMGRE